VILTYNFIFTGWWSLSLRLHYGHT